MRRSGLTIKIFIGTIAIVLFLGIVLIVFARTVLTDTLYRTLQKRGVSIAKNIAQNSLNLLLTERYVELELMIREQAKSSDDIEYIYILNSRREVAADTFRGGFPAGLQDVNQPRPGEQVSILRLESEKGILFDIAVSLLNGSAGVAHVGMSEQPVKRDVDHIVRLIIGTVVIVLVTGMVGAAALSARITRPLRKLERTTNAVRRGDLGARVRVRSDDEIGDLGLAFNDMLEARQQAEGELKSSERKLRGITASLGEGVIVLSEQGTLMFMNPEAERLLGWSEADLAGKDVHSVMHYHKPDGSPLAREECPCFKAFRSHEPVVIDDDIFMAKSGSRIPVAYIAAPIRENGTVHSIVIVFRDITRQKQYAADREQLILAYEDALANIKTLKGLMPICASCKRIRDDKGYWNQIESYIREHSDAEFSHGLCPECAQKIYPQYYKNGDT